MVTVEDMEAASDTSDTDPDTTTDTTSTEEGMLQELESTTPHTLATATDPMAMATEDTTVVTDATSVSEVTVTATSTERRPKFDGVDAPIFLSCLNEAADIICVKFLRKSNMKNNYLKTQKRSKKQIKQQKMISV